jgi:hypothetical protein
VIVTWQGKGSFVADALDAKRSLAVQEFEAQLKGLLDAARKLGLSRQDIVCRVEDALPGAPDATQASTKPDRGKQE